MGLWPVSTADEGEPPAFPSQTPEEKEDDRRFIERSGNVLRFDYLFAVKQGKIF